MLLISRYLESGQIALYIQKWELDTESKIIRFPRDQNFLPNNKPGCWINRKMIFAFTTIKLGKIDIFLIELIDSVLDASSPASRLKGDHLFINI